jgi:CheY-like chemotaxis protein
MNLPVLMLSTNAGRHEIIEASQAGVNGFLAKPFVPDSLQKKIIELYRLQRRIEQDRNAAKVWQGRATYATRMARPFVIFGEAIQSEEELLSPGNREVKSYLNQAWLAIARCNERQPDLNAEYVIESQTKDINLYLKKEEGLQWVKAIFLSCSMSRERIGNRAPASYQQGQDAAHIPHLRPEGGYSRFPDDWPQETGNQDREKGQADREDRRSDAVAPGGGS